MKSEREGEQKKLWASLDIALDLLPDAHSPRLSAKQRENQRSLARREQGRQVNLDLAPDLSFPSQFLHLCGMDLIATFSSHG